MKRNLSAFLCLFISILCIFALSSCDEEEIVSSDNSSGITESAEESASSDDSSNITESTEESSTIETESESETESKITSKVTFDSNGGSLVEEQVVENNSRITLPKSPTKEGYTFDGWYVGDEKWSFIRDLVLGDITLSAKWIANENAIIFNANGGTGTI
ncbi:MAG: InlB B-repeat-containing protein [Clostridia bacterium]|nr:InlB B-repeat-containing protein [Clostridia bacterium]